MVTGNRVDKMKSKEIFIMTAISSKHRKRQRLVDPVLALLLLIAILTFAMLTPFNGNASDTLESMFGSFGNSSTTLSGSNTVSFAYDQAYWNSSCSHGWSDNATCDVIVQRAQSCAISVDSAYCAAYEAYLKDFTK
jgi:hypothetical protein